MFIPVYENTNIDGVVSRRAEFVIFSKSKVPVVTLNKFRQEEIKNALSRYDVEVDFKNTKVNFRCVLCLTQGHERFQYSDHITLLRSR